MAGLGLMFAFACGESADTVADAPDSTASGSVASSVKATPTTQGKFAQTWKKGYAETTCGEWQRSMSETERRIAAADMLVGARKTDKNTKLPSDTLITDFKQNISTACEAIASFTIVDTAIGVYVLDKAHWLR